MSNCDSWDRTPLVLTRLTSKLSSTINSHILTNVNPCVARQTLGTLNSSSPDSISASKFLIKNISVISYAPAEYSLPGNNENYELVVAASRSYYEPPFTV